MDVKLPANRLEADRLVAASMERWDTGGRDQLHDTFLSSWPQTDSGPAATAFPSLLTALLSSHLAHPRLLPGAYTAIFEALKKQEQSSVASAASSSASQNGASPAPVPETSEALVDAILDGIWAVDAELDARKDLSASTALWAAADGSKSPAEIVARCRASLAQIVKELIQKQIIPRLTTAERLDLPLLKAVGLIMDETGFQRKGVRMNTANLYKQQKFNLLREENEGYSGLINELISGMGPSIIPIKHDAVQASNGLADGEASKSTSDLPAQYRVVEQESVDARNARARRVMGNISALIGYFDLDPNRVLDVVMDVFSSNVVSHWPFFLALLSVSPWAPSHPDAQRANDDDITMQDEESFLGPIRLDFSQDRGNSTVAQVLGFKYGFYQMPDTREDTPDDLYFMTALMIKNSLIRFADLFPHLSPKEEGMKQLHQAYRKTLSAPSASTTKANALTMAAPLIEDGLHRPGGAGGAETEQIRQAEATASAKEPPNQIGGLLRALLAVGGLRHAVFILGRYPWLCSSLDGVAELYARLLRRVLEPATATISTAPLYEPDPRLAPKAPRSERESRSKGPPRPILSMNPMPQPKAKAASESKRGPELIPVFFYPIWDKELPGCEPKAVLTDFVPFLRLLGVNLAKDMELMKQVSRLTKVGLRMAMRKLEQDIASEEGREKKAAWLEVVRSLLLPALSCTYGDWDIAQEVWLIIHRLTYQERYALYGEWKYDLYRKPELKARQIATEREAKGILKRISSENVRQSAKDLATASHANPCIFLTVALNQVQAYDNLIAPIVECAKYLSELEYDVFTFILLDALSNPEKERTKQDGTNISLWLKSLSSFAGMLYRRHKEIDVGPVLQYMANQLKQDNSKDLVLIRELVLKMSGIEPLANLGDKQIAALTGGRLLRREAMMVANAQIGSDTRREFHDSGARLLLAMEASCMTIPLLILIAQQRQACIYLIGDDEGGLKYMGNAFDSCQETLFQYVEFLLTQLEPSAYSTLIPKLSDLYSRFSIEPAIAFHMARPRLLMAMKLADANQAEERLKAEVKAKAVTKIASNEHSATSKDTRSLGQPDDTAQRTVDSQADGTVEPGQEKTDQAMEVEMTAISPASTSLPGVKSVWRPGMEEAISAAKEMLPAAVSAVLGPHFFASFWQLSLSDIAVPIERYDVETNALQTLAKANDHERRGNLKTRDHALEILSHLKAELKAQTLAHSATRRRLAVEKGHWFAHISTPTERAQLVSQLLEHCILPRALLSPTDAIFAGRFIRLMHANGTTNFSSLMTYDRIFVDHVAPIIFACTENEARNYARFLQQVLSDLSAWHVDEAVYAKEAVGAELPGFRPRWTIAQSLPWESFRQLFHKWHIALLQAFELCLASSEYMRLRNVIVVMTRIAHYFPLDEQHGKVLCLAVQKLVDEEDRGDLKVLGQGLLATLKKGQSAWLPVWKFKSDPPAQSAAAAAAEAEKTVAKSAKDAKANAAPPAKASETTAAKSFNDTSPLPTRPKSNAPPMGPAAERGVPGRNPQAPPARPTHANDHPATSTDVSASRPALDRAGSSSLPPRPPPRTAERDRPPPSAPRSDLPKHPRQAVGNNTPTSMAARQAAAGTMVAPQRPADTAGAQAARDRAQGNSTPRPAKDSTAREGHPTPSSAPRASSRNVSPARDSRAPSVDSSRSRESKDRGRDSNRERLVDREREPIRDSDDTVPQARDSQNRSRPRETERETDRSAGRGGSGRDPRMDEVPRVSRYADRRAREAVPSEESDTRTATHRGDDRRRREDPDAEARALDLGSKSTAKPTPRETAGNADRNGRSHEDAAQPTSSHKRTLADRFGASDQEGKVAAGTPIREEADRAGDSKRAKLDRSRASNRVGVEAEVRDRNDNQATTPSGPRKGQLSPPASRSDVRSTPSGPRLDAQSRRPSTSQQQEQDPKAERGADPPPGRGISILGGGGGRPHEQALQRSASDNARPVPKGPNWQRQREAEPATSSRDSVDAREPRAPSNGRSGERGARGHGRDDSRAQVGASNDGLSRTRERDRRHGSGSEPRGPRSQQERSNAGGGRSSGGERERNRSQRRSGRQ
ncbi:KEKE-like motif-containing transcription regulator (Rlr1)/suppressor of sin4 [Ceraceosorus bombacis]|uniref:THO complex subunit 2 n=1 Tax=Ceraceosorus bombacis TaxID=401625 RepID=A0A0P1BR10_9BASI|nr:KEKE-like motif-containing transcription regulator (Rlr1)/suppressor of sin4 [Ceraceosorus bombacis]